MSGAVTLTPGSELFVSTAPLAPEWREAQPWQLAYELSGPDGAPVVLVQGGISAGRHAAATAAHPEPGWWEAFVGEGKAVDRARFRVLGVDWLVGQVDGPRISSHEQARATARLLEHLEVERLHAWVGSSYGGMVALAFGAEFPERVAHVVAISAPHESHPIATAWRSLQRRVIRLGIQHGCAGAALAIARGLGMVSYRSAEEFLQRFAGEPEIVADAGGERVRFPVESYLEARGAAFVAAHDPERILLLSLAIDLHRIVPEEMRGPVTLVGATSDQLVPPAQLRELAQRLGGPARLHEIDSLYGHDAFLKEVDAVSSIVGAALAEVAS